MPIPHSLDTRKVLHVILLVMRRIPKNPTLCNIMESSQFTLLIILDIHIMQMPCTHRSQSYKNSAQYGTTYSWNTDMNVHAQKRDRQNILIHIPIMRT